MKSIRDRICEQSTTKHDRKPESVNTHNNLDPINRYRMIKTLMKWLGSALKIEVKFVRKWFRNRNAVCYPGKKMLSSHLH